MEFWDIVRYIKKVGAAQHNNTSYMEYCTYTLGNIKMETQNWTCYTKHVLYVDGEMCVSISQHLSTTKESIINLQKLQNAIAAIIA